MVELLLLTQMLGRVVVAVGLLLPEQMQQQELLETAGRERRHLSLVVALPMPVAAAVAYKDQIKHLGQVVLGAVVVAHDQFHLKTRLLEPRIQAVVAVLDVKRP